MLMFNPSKMLFMMMLILGTMISISSNSWPATWMGLEINLLAFIPLMSSKSNMMSTEAAMKYFIIQAMASSMLLTFIMQFYFVFHKCKILLTSLNFYHPMLKLGQHPFMYDFLLWSKDYHDLIVLFWLHDKNSPHLLFYPTCHITNQLSFLYYYHQFLLVQLEDYIKHQHVSSYLIPPLITSDEYYWDYFYRKTFDNFTSLFIQSYQQQFWWSFPVFPLNILIKFHLDGIHQYSSFLFQLTLCLLVVYHLSYGFLPKWMIIQNSCHNNMQFLVLVMILFTLITLFYYLRLMMMSFLINVSQLKWSYSQWYQKMINFHWISLLTSMSLLLLPFYPIMFFSM
uniref:NADH-ubiquinone oxidoreductase chain 2 n=1 Tax=Teleogryllus infernalis TaxID=1132643 RepID=A0A7L9QCR6_9ORTH|nr:NADH dehydrogenase subunit 2 [Teleogryllus infernalis]